MAFFTIKFMSQNLNLQTVLQPIHEASSAMTLTGWPGEGELIQCTNRTNRFST